MAGRPPPLEDLFEAAVAASEDEAAEWRELAVQLLWRVAQLCHHHPHLPRARALEPDAVSRLCVLLADESTRVRRRACLLLASLPHVAPSTLALISRKRNPRDLRGKGEGLGHSRGDRAEAEGQRAEAEGGAEGQRRKVREEAVDGGLLLALEDEDAGVRRAAVAALAALTSRQGGRIDAPAVSLMLDATADEDAGLRLHALRTLGSIAGRAEVLLFSLSDPSPPARQAVLRLLRGCRLEDSATISAVSAALAAAAAAFPHDEAELLTCAHALGRSHAALLAAAPPPAAAAFSPPPPGEPPPPHALVAHALACGAADPIGRDESPRRLDDAAAAARLRLALRLRDEPPPPPPRALPNGGGGTPLCEPGEVLLPQGFSAADFHFACAAAPSCGDPSAYTEQVERDPQLCAWLRSRGRSASALGLLLAYGAAANARAPPPPPPPPAGGGGAPRLLEGLPDAAELVAARASRPGGGGEPTAAGAAACGAIARQAVADAREMGGGGGALAQLQRAHRRLRELCAPPFFLLRLRLAALVFEARRRASVVHFSSCGWGALRMRRAAHALLAATYEMQHGYSALPSALLPLLQQQRLWAHAASAAQTDPPTPPRPPPAAALFARRVSIARHTIRRLSASPHPPLLAALLPLREMIAALRPLLEPRAAGGARRQLLPWLLAHAPLLAPRAAEAHAAALGAPRRWRAAFSPPPAARLPPRAAALSLSVRAAVEAFAPPWEECVLTLELPAAPRRHVMPVGSCSFQLDATLHVDALPAHVPLTVRLARRCAVDVVEMDAPICTGQSAGSRRFVQLSAGNDLGLHIEERRLRFYGVTAKYGR
ncbi:hypothetical protein AB1Y20_006512 [Prymnesium parvum]|uniref:Integrator complex subunit 4 n=1 Tax=Prymnesium parvum TaxID=97485 RepID=A0AB34IYB3_PRYPA